MNDEYNFHYYTKRGECVDVMAQYHYYLIAFWRSPTEYRTHKKHFASAEEARIAISRMARAHKWESRGRNVWAERTTDADRPRCYNG